MNKYLIINASLVTNSNTAQLFDFAINQDFQAIEFRCVNSSEELTIEDIENQLFEINHVRVNPQLDNSEILHNFRELLTNCGVEIYNVPKINDIKILYNPVGEFSTIVRFYMNKNRDLTFLAPTIKLRLV